MTTWSVSPLNAMQVNRSSYGAISRLQVWLVGAAEKREKTLRRKTAGANWNTLFCLQL